MSSETSTTQPAKIPMSSILTVGFLALVLSVAINLVALFVLKAILPIPPEFEPMAAGPITTFTILGVIGAVIAFFIVSRMARDVKRVYGIVVIVALIISLIPDVLPIFNPEAAMFPNGTPLAWTAMIVFHLIPAAICYWTFTRIVPAPADDGQADLDTPPG